MFQALALCPVMHTRVPLPIQVETISDWESLAIENSQFECPVCGGVHLLVKEQTILRDESA